MIEYLKNIHAARGFEKIDGNEFTLQPTQVRNEHQP
jgi:hypothetical protein